MMLSFTPPAFYNTYEKKKSKISYSRGKNEKSKRTAYFFSPAAIDVNSDDFLYSHKLYIALEHLFLAFFQ